MLDLLRARLRQRTDPTPMPADGAALPARFRGRPAIRATTAGSSGRSLPVIDLGRSVFAPEEFADGNQARIHHRLSNGGEEPRGAGDQDW